MRYRSELLSMQLFIGLLQLHTSSLTHNTIDKSNSHEEKYKESIKKKIRNRRMQEKAQREKKTKLTMATC